MLRSAFSSSRGFAAVGLPCPAISRRIRRALSYRAEKWHPSVGAAETTGPGKAASSVPAAPTSPAEKLLFSPGCQKQAPESRFLTPGEFSPGGSGPKADLRSLVFALENAIATSVI